ncbi:hypothetical protein THRCLA_03732 [Thraustotheca clavata]|uniref:PA14 domain-containing protein n=1 Tax=Thraustotheca clavata TaxID=74557 RepID=A0A1W0A1S2_9STRA|nr:hypothetical protein THRCLA_03732 [Thraustotheca clavata]
MILPFIFLYLLRTRAFRIVNNSSATSTPLFNRYAHGIVGYYGDPTTTFFREHVNPGAIFHPDAPTQWNGPSISLSCPSMVGPLDNGEYYCNGKEYGYCDRRSGSCWCNKGYTGIDCTECIPEYFQAGGICYPRRTSFTISGWLSLHLGNCLNDCSGQGSCNYMTGLCTCNPSRLGSDCSQVSCHVLDTLCQSCSDGQCLQCFSGYYVTPMNACAPCTNFDPRCIECNAVKGCLTCADFQLNSIKRSGPRTIDPWPMPSEEIVREFSLTNVYSSQSSHSFDEAEVYSVLPSSLNITQACQQGLSGDASWKCVNSPSSHIICGHTGTITFASPSYAIAQNSTFLPITIVRTGGGYGEASVLYELVHRTSTKADVSPTAYYTTTQRLTFPPSVIQLTFYITIHDNPAVKPYNPVFDLVLKEPSANVAIGNQRISTVVIYEGPGAINTKLQLAVNSTGVANISMPIAIYGPGLSLSSTMVGTATYTSGNLVDVDEIPLSLAFNGTQLVSSWLPVVSGNYTLLFFQLYAGGLLGTYYSTPSLEGSVVVERMDAVINFTFTDTQSYSIGYESVRWRGFIKATTSELTTFQIDTLGSIRLWVQGKLVVDGWVQLDAPNHSGSVQLQANKLYSIQLDYRPHPITLDYIYLKWQTTTIPLQVIPTSQLYTSTLLPWLNKSIIIQPNMPSQAWYRGPLSGIAGVPFTYSFYSVDSLNNIRRNLFFNTQDTGVFRSYISSGLITLDAKLTFNVSSGLIKGSTVPTVAGLYTLSVLLNQQLLYGFPIGINLSPSPNTGPQSFVSGPGIQVTGNVAATTTTILIQGIDIYGNQQSFGGGNFTIIATHLASAKVDLGVVTDFGNGSYLVSYTPRFSGTYSITITILGIHVASSPYLIITVPNIAYGPSCSVISGNTIVFNIHHDDLGAGISVGTTGVPAVFLVQLRDVNSNTIVSGSATVSLNSTSLLQAPLCTNLLNGTYSCSYIPTSAGTIILSVFVNNNPIANSPFNVQMTTGVIMASSSIATSPFGSTGLYYGIAGENTWFLLQAQDTYGNNRSSVDLIGLSFQNATLAAVNATSTNITYLGSGLYNVNYTIVKAGTYIMHVVVNGSTEIYQSPFTITIYPNVADIITTTATILTPLPLTAGQSITAAIEPRDIYGNPTTQTYYDFYTFGQIQLVKPSLTLTTFTPTVAGIHRFEPQIYLNGGGNVSVYSMLTEFGAATYLTKQPLGFDQDFNLLIDGVQWVWDGYISSVTSERYVLTLDFHGHVEMYLNNTLMVNSSAESFQFEYTFTASLKTKCHVVYTKSDTVQPHYFHVNWSSLTVQQRPIPLTCLCSKWKITSITPILQVYPAPPAQYQLLSSIPDVWNAGISVSFDVIALDMYGNIRAQGGDRLGVYLSNAASSIVDHYNGSYSITMTAFTAGSLQTLNIGVNATPIDSAISPYAYIQSLSPILNSPFSVTILPSTVQLKSTLFSSITSGIAGKPLSFTFTLVDSYNNVVITQQPIQVYLGSLPCTTTFIASTYTVNCIPQLATLPNVRLVLGSSDLTFFSISISPSSANATSSSITSFTSLQQANQLQSFVVILYDSYNNPLTTGGNYLGIIFSGKSELHVPAVDAGNGTYIIYYSLPFPGVYQAQVLLVSGSGLLGRYYASESDPLPETSQVDSVLALTDHAKVIWSGFLVPTYSEVYLLTWSVANVVVYLDNRLVEGSVTLIGNYPHAIQIQASGTIPALILQWTSARTPKQPIPLSQMYPWSDEILPRHNVYVVT